MRTRIISAFPGCGKSHYFNENKTTTLDSDSSHFSWVKDKDGNNTKERNPQFPQNYITHIKNNIGKYEFIFVSSHKDVREALQNECIFFYLVYPERDRKDEFVQRYIDRGSPEGFVNLIKANWDEWIDECDNERIGCDQIEMVLDNLSDELKHLISYENGELVEEDIEIHEEIDTTLG